MINLSKTLKMLSFGTAVVGSLLIAGSFSEANAQRDPFVKPGYMKQKTQAPAGGTGKTGKAAAQPFSYAPPSIEARIEYFKRQREAAAASGATLPKVTSVLTLNEMAVTGIFKTPRGYAAMVEATPIKLSYTIYPGEKFFDGQLVAVEENRLVFRKVTKTAPNKFVASVENKPLQQYSMKSQVEGTAPAQGSSERPVQTAANPPAANGVTPVGPAPVMSPLDEMNNQPAETDKGKTKKDTKRPIKVAKNKK